MNGNDTESNIKQKRSSQGASSDAKSRNWRFLFDNLKRFITFKLLFLYTKQDILNQNKKIEQTSLYWILYLESFNRNRDVRTILMNSWWNWKKFLKLYNFRAVGYIYSMCEQDGDIEECKVWPFLI